MVDEVKVVQLVQLLKTIGNILNFCLVVFSSSFGSLTLFHVLLAFAYT
jgi:hypothetical protein